MLARIQTEESTKNWAAEVERAVAVYNHLVHTHLNGRSPDEVQDDGDLRLHLEKQAAEDMQHNSEVIKKGDAKITAAGFFREQLPAQKFRRGFHLKYGDKVHAVKSVFNNRVVDSGDKDFVGRHVLPGPIGSSDINTGDTNTVVAPADEKKKTALEPFKDRISNFLGNLGKFEFEVATYMKEIGMERLMVHGLSYRRAMQLLGFTGRGNAHEVARFCHPLKPPPHLPPLFDGSPVSSPAVLVQ